MENTDRFDATSRSLAIEVGRRLCGSDVIEALSDAMIAYGIPEHLRLVDSPEMASRAVREWLGSIGSQTLLIEPGSPWEIGYNESFNGNGETNS